MQLSPEALIPHLKRGLAALYLISGDEPLLVQECVDAVRSAAIAEHYTERQIVEVDSAFQWSMLTHATASLSLFAKRRMIELRMPSGKPGPMGAKALSAYVQMPAADTLLMIVSGKLETATRSSEWYKAIDAQGVVVSVWPVEARALPGWIEKRLRSKGMRMMPQAAALLADRVEGNLLAAAQEIDKLLLQYGSDVIDVTAVTASVTDSARFDVFGLVDSLLGQDAARAARRLLGLRAEGIEPVLALWALAREFRTLAAMAYALKGGAQLESVLAKHKIWDKRKPLIRNALRHGQCETWRDYLCVCARIDRIIKGLEPGDAWEELLKLSMLVAGRPLFREAIPGKRQQHDRTLS